MGGGSGRPRRRLPAARATDDARALTRPDPGWRPRVGSERKIERATSVLRAPAGLHKPCQSSRRLLPLTGAQNATEVEALATERFAAVGQAVLAALAESGLSGHRVANVVSWFTVAQLALGPWRNSGEVRPAELARAMGVSRWTEWRTRRDAAHAGLVRDWTLPDPEARGYGRGAVRVLELAFVRTREVTKRVAANREEKATRAERRREARRQAKEARRAVRPTAAPAESVALPTAQVRREDLTSPAAGRLWEMLLRVQSAPASDGSALAQAHPPPG